jgi:hypothetical protein
MIAIGPNDPAKGGGGAGAITGAAAAGLAAKIKASQETMHTLATDTGGKG